VLESGWPAVGHGGRRWERQTLAVAGRPRGPPDAEAAEAVNRAFFSPDGRRIVTAGLDGIGQVWDAKTGQRSDPHCGTEDMVLSAGFNQTGDRVVNPPATGSADLEVSTGRSSYVSPLQLRHAMGVSAGMDGG